MKEYIERAAVQKLVLATALVYGGEPDQYTLFLDKLDKIPAAEVVEVRHGRWIWNAHHCKWECSECGGMEGECESPVCKWCGTRMDKEDEP